MKTGMRKTAAATAILVLASACQTTGGGVSGQTVLVKSGLTVNAFDTDVEACEGYVETEGPSESEQGAATAASFLLGGIIGGIAAASSYENNKKRLMRECMYGKGYRNVVLPDEWEGDYTDSQGLLPEYYATSDLLEQGRLDVLLEYSNGSKSLASLQPDIEPAAPTTRLPEPAQDQVVADDTDAGGDPVQEAQIWKIVENSTDPKDMEFYLNAFPDGKYVPLANQRLLALNTATITNSGFPYDGIWRLKVDLTATRQIAWEPDICKFSARKPDRVTITAGALNFVVGSGMPTIVTADVSEGGKVSGEIDSRGYGGHNSSFNVVAKAKSMMIPFKIGTSCKGNIILSRT